MRGREGGGQGGDGAGVQGLGDPEQEDLGVLEGCGHRRAAPDSGAHIRPLVAAAGRADCGGEGWSLGRGCRGLSELVPAKMEPGPDGGSGLGEVGGFSKKYKGGTDGTQDG